MSFLLSRSMTSSLLNSLFAASYIWLIQKLRSCFLHANSKVSNLIMHAALTERGLYFSLICQSEYISKLYIKPLISGLRYVLVQAPVMFFLKIVDIIVICHCWCCLALMPQLSSSWNVLIKCSELPQLVLRSITCFHGKKVGTLNIQIFFQNFFCN